MFSLAGKKALVLGIANDRSIAYGCAEAFREQGADIAHTYLNDKAKTSVEPLAEKLGAVMILPLDIGEDSRFAERQAAKPRTSPAVCTASAAAITL